ncbi:cupin domain-containing protein [Microbacterium gorillae]|uniref:cupin domain-containing protein n=1 Tax=Microbacterium gorillae TaxID=1231063 RepID=UPI000B31E16F|nr:cupin domain-containing protein [Microbacterium gorillae]
MSAAVIAAPRRVVVGIDDAGRSAFLSDDRDAAALPRANGTLMHELWRQDTPTGGVAPAVVGPVPETGFVVRTLTLPPHAAGTRPAADLHTSPASYVITVLEGELLVTVEAGESLLGAGETIVIPGSMHDIVNPTEHPTRIVFTMCARTTEA